jgi:hypothetical protein
MVNTYYDSKFTQTAASNGFALASSPNSFHVEGGIYAPIYMNRTRWDFDHGPSPFVPLSRRGHARTQTIASDLRQSRQCRSMEQIHHRPHECSAASLGH